DRIQRACRRANAHYGDAAAHVDVHRNPGAGGLDVDGVMAPAGDDVDAGDLSGIEIHFHPIDRDLHTAGGRQAEGERIVESGANRVAAQGELPAAQVEVLTDQGVDDEVGFGGAEARDQVVADASRIPCVRAGCDVIEIQAGCGIQEGQCLARSVQG